MAEMRIRTPKGKNQTVKKIIGNLWNVSFWEEENPGGIIIRGNNHDLADLKNLLETKIVEC